MNRIPSQYQSPKSSETTEKPQPQGSPISGILKGGRLWKQQNQQGTDPHYAKNPDVNLLVSWPRSCSVRP